MENSRLEVQIVAIQCFSMPTDEAPQYNIVKLNDANELSIGNMISSEEKARMQPECYVRIGQHYMEFFHRTHLLEQIAKAPNKENNVAVLEYLSTTLSDQEDEQMLGYNVFTKYK